MIKKIITIWNKINSKHFTTLAGALSFFIIINGGSIFLLYFLVSSKINIDYLPILIEALYDERLRQFIYYFYTTADQISSSISLFIFITSIWSSSSFFYHLLKVGELVYGVKKRPFKFFNRIVAILTVFIFLLLLFLIIFLFVTLLVFLKLYNFVPILLTLVIFPLFIVFFCHYVSIPTKIKIKYIYKGILISYFYCVIASIGFAVFLKYANFKAIYGVLSFFVILMFWIYLNMQGIVIGIIYNSERIQKMSL